MARPKETIHYHTMAFKPLNWNGTMTKHFFMMGRKIFDCYFKCSSSTFAPPLSLPFDAEAAPAAAGKRRRRRETRPSGILKCSLDNKAQSAQKPRKERNFSPSFAEIICDGKKAANLLFICDIFILWILCRKLLIQRSPAIGSC